MRMLAAVASLAVLALANASQAAEAPKVTIKPVARTDKTVLGQPIVVPPNAELRAFTVEFEPGARLRVHKHPWPHYVYVEKGTLTVMNEETGKPLTFKQGSFFAEMTDTWHYGINRTNAPVKLLVIEQMPKTAASNTVLKPAK
jgi:quercetin dioxygenase-like cupin family protein